jgi:hypothetical protein
MAQKRKSKKKKVRFKTISFKLTSNQNKSLQNYCKARKTTPTKLIKKMIRSYISGYSKVVPEAFYFTENQLDMFEEVDEK